MISNKDTAPVKNIFMGADLLRVRETKGNDRHKAALVSPARNDDGNGFF